MHKNNFDFLRLIFAIFVIVSHSYPITGAPEGDWLFLITNGQSNFSSIGISGFFCISGFLIYNSAIRSKGVVDYFIKRSLRIFPGLLVMLVLTAILGVFISKYSFKEYFTNIEPYSYVIRNVVLFRYMKWYILDIFEKNPYPGFVNGSLWSIPYEFFMYILFCGLFLFKEVVNKKKLFVIVLFFILLALKIFYFNYDNDIWIPFVGISLKQLSHFGLLFVGGALLGAFNIQTIPFKKSILVVAISLAVLSYIFNIFTYTQFLLFPLINILFGVLSTPGLAGINHKFGDLSYGIYLYGFPIQQTLIHFFMLTTLQLTVSAVLLSIICAYFSWNLIEKQSLSLKNKFFKGTFQ